MKIAIITAGVLPVPAVKGGAVETLTEYLLNKNEEYKKHQFTVYSIGDSNITSQEVDKYNNTEFIFINKSDLYKKINNLCKRVMKKLFAFETDDFYIKEICKIIKKEKYDYILIENRSNYVLPINKVTNDKILLHIHNDYLNTYIPNNKDILEKCTKVLTVSNYIKGRVETIEENDKIKKWTNCVDVDYFTQNSTMESRNEWRKKYNIKDDEVVILFSGRITEYKGIKELIHAITQIDQNLNYKLCIVGGSWYSNDKKDNFKKELEDISEVIKDKVIFTGYIPFKNMCYVYNMADISVVPSIWDDPAPLVVMESMIQGLPLIVTDSGGIPEYINSKCAIEIKRDENLIDNLSIQIEKLVIDKELRQDMANEAKKHAVKFNTDAYYNDFNDFIENNIEVGR